MIRSLSALMQGVKVVLTMEESTTNTTLKEAILNNWLNLHPPKSLTILEEADIVWDNDTGIPFMFVADNAFLLSENIMKPYPQSNLNDIKQIFFKQILFISFSNS